MNHPPAGKLALRSIVARCWTYPVIVAALARAFRGAMGNSRDFRVYWEGVTAWIGGGDPYAVLPENIGFVFKYPPWTLPLLLPVGLLPWEASKAAWFLVETGCIAALVAWLARHGVRRSLLLLTFGMFWWLTLAHLISGQFTLVTMAALLWASEYPKAKGRGAWRWSVAAYLASVKVFGMVALAGAWRRWLQPTALVLAAGSVLAAMALVLAVSAWVGGPLWTGGVTASLEAVFRSWSAAAASGGRELGEAIVRGQGNHGLPALALRALKVSALDTRADFLAWAACSLGLGLLWHRFSRGLEFAQRWAGWLAISVITHPLAWHHSFVMTIPLCAMSLEASWRSRLLRWRALALLGVFMIAMLIPQICGGVEGVAPFELAGVKAWGTILCAFVLSAASARERRRGPRA